MPSNEPVRYTRFRDIPQYITTPGSAVHVTWRYLEDWLRDASEPNGLELDPDFQRGHVWTREQQIAYVEYALQGGPSGRTLFWNDPTRNHRYRGAAPMVLVDGKQRLTAVRAFMADEFSAFGTLYSEFTDRLAGLSMSGAFLMAVNTLGTRGELLTWYLQLNAGGTPHSPEEIARIRGLLDAETGGRLVTPATGGDRRRAWNEPVDD